MPAAGTTRVSANKRLKVAALRMSGVPGAEIARQVGVSPNYLPILANDPRTKSIMFAMAQRSGDKLQVAVDTLIVGMTQAITEAKPAERLSAMERVMGMLERIDSAGRSILQLEAQAAGIGQPGAPGEASGAQFADVVIALRQRLAPAAPAQPALTGEVIDAART